MENALRQIAKELLESKRVGVVIGYGKGALENSVTPIFVTSPGDVDKLIFNQTCYQNLSRYLRKPEVKGLGKMAIVVKGCDMRSINSLIAENQLKREDIYVIGAACNGMLDPNPAQKSKEPCYMSKCIGCAVRQPQGCDSVAGTIDETKAITGLSLEEEIAKLEALSPAERWAFWKSEFERCIRCYACRQICPMCFCQTCITEKSQPQWISSSPSPAGNFAWNAFRAFHLAGRCSGCQECSRACPVGIRLDLINKKLALDVKNLYGFESGADAAAKPPLSTYKPDDNQDFIK